MRWTVDRFSHFYGNAASVSAWAAAVLALAGCLPRASTGVSPVGFASADPVVPAYPPAHRGDIVDDYGGVKVPDPYRWLEQLDSPETRAWVRAEAQLTDSYLAKSAAGQALKTRLTGLLDFERYGVPFHEGEHFFIPTTAASNSKACCSPCADFPASRP